jgi:hypothetical protein
MGFRPQPCSAIVVKTRIQMGYNKIQKINFAKVEISICRAQSYVFFDVFIMMNKGVMWGVGVCWVASEGDKGVKQDGNNLKKGCDFNNNKQKK